VKRNPSFRGPKRVNLDETLIQIPLLTCCPALQHLLKHTILVSTALVMSVQRQHLRGVSRLLENRFFDDWKPRNMTRITILTLPYCLVDSVAWWYAHMIYTSSPKEKEMIFFCESFGYGGQDALDKRFYRSNGVRVPAEKGLNIPIMGFSLTPQYNGLFKSYP
jgi:hypothetical protein